jgi:hypothetical protein
VIIISMIVSVFSMFATFWSYHVRSKQYFRWSSKLCDWVCVISVRTFLSFFPSKNSFQFCEIYSYRKTKLDNAGLIPDQRYRTDPVMPECRCRNADAGLTQLTAGKNADARYKIFPDIPAFRHLLIQ